MALWERDAVDLTLTAQCELLTLNRTGLYYQPKPPSPQEVAIKHRIDAIYTDHPFYGSRKIAVALRPDFIVNRKAVQRHMREMGLVAMVPGPHLSKPHPDHQIYPFTSPQYIERLVQKQIAISMDGRGRALDNIFTERLWRSVKYEEVYLHEYGSPKEARHGLTRYFDFYNHERPHQALDYRTPAQVYLN